MISADSTMRSPSKTSIQISADEMAVCVWWSVVCSAVLFVGVDLVRLFVVRAGVAREVVDLVHLDL